MDEARASRHEGSPSMPTTDAGTGIVVYLNGIACSGKSTLARGLQASWPEPFLHIGLDFLSAAMPSRFLGDGPDAELGARWLRDDEGRLLRVEAGPFGVRLLQGIPRLAAALARAGNHVIVDDVLLYPWRIADVAKALTGVPTHLVEVRCDLAIAIARGQQRDGVSEVGKIATYYDATYAHDAYDLRIDTGRDTPEANVAALTAYLRSGRAPTALAAVSNVARPS